MQLLQSRALPLGYVAGKGSGRRGSNPRLSPWQGDALPLSHSRICEILFRISIALLRYHSLAVLSTGFSRKSWLESGSLSFRILLAKSEAHPIKLLVW